MSVLVLAAAAALLGVAYSFVTDSANLAAFIRQEAPRFLPNAMLNVGRVQMRPFLGEVTVTHIVLWKKLDGKVYTAARIPWLNIKEDVQTVLHGRLEPREVVVAQPTLRVHRRKDGTWNLSDLLADPWPGPRPESYPVVLIQKGTVELIDERGETSSTLLRDVALRIEPTAEGPLHFEGSAQGDTTFSRLRFEGTYDRATGRIDLTKGDLTRLMISETVVSRLPDELRARFAHVGLQRGEVDVILKSLVYDPTAKSPLVHYAGALQLRDGTWSCEQYLPFTLDQVGAVATIEDGKVSVQSAEGRNGKTIVKAKGQLSADDPVSGPVDMLLEITNLELDQRLKEKTPSKYLPLWREFQPRGLVDLALLVRARAGEDRRFGLTVNCQDVAMNYFQFPYPLEHVRGTLVWEGSKITVDMRTVVGRAWLTGQGTIENPGLDAVVKLDFRSPAMPIDETLMKALPPDARIVVDQFHPVGTVRGVTEVRRRPPTSPGLRDNVAITVKLDLNEGCAMRWDGLPYPISDLTGRLELYPDHWVFKNMRGRNGTAEIEANGEVQEVAPGRQAVALRLTARHLPFEQQLHDALPKEWQVTWDTLRPVGSSNVDADIRVEPGRQPRYVLKIDPEADTRITPLIQPVDGTTVAAAGPRPGPIQLPPMENIRGTFLFDSGQVKIPQVGNSGTLTMSHVGFDFREAPVRFKAGSVVVGNNGRFDLKVDDLEVSRLRPDAVLRRIMPPVMAEFAQRLDDGKPFAMHTNLHITWSGESGKPASVDWDNASIVFDDNTIQCGLPVRNIQGQLQSVRGWSDGRKLELKGVVNLESVSVGNQQFTRVTSPIQISDGWARLNSIEGTILGGEVRGDVDISLDQTPKYRAHLTVREADLREYAQTVPGHQSVRGLISGSVEVEGLGGDMRNLSGKASAKMVDGDLGQLPFVLRWVKVPNFRPPTKTAFNSADFTATMRDGIAELSLIRLIGDAFSLQGSGTLDLARNLELDLHLSPIFGRDDLHVLVLSDVIRETGGKLLFDIHVSGPVTAPTVRPEPLPSVLSRTSEAFRRMKQRKAEKKGDDGPQ
jgi:hypothetical protein